MFFNKVKIGAGKRVGLRKVPECDYPMLADVINSEHAAAYIVSALSYKEVEGLSKSECKLIVDAWAAKHGRGFLCWVERRRDAYSFAKESESK